MNGCDITSQPTSGLSVHYPGTRLTVDHAPMLLFIPLESNELVQLESTLAHMRPHGCFALIDEIFNVRVMPVSCNNSAGYLFGLHKKKNCLYISHS